MTNVPWIESYGINYYVGLDGFSLTILMMIAILIPTAYLTSYGKVELKVIGSICFWFKQELQEHYCLLDVVLFYFFWEVMLLPVFLMIGAYGFGDKVVTTIKVTVYTMVGSLLMFIAIVILGVAYHNEFGLWSFAYNELVKITTIDYSTKVWLFLGFLSSLCY